MNQQSPIQNSNVFSEVFEQYNQSQAIARLESKFQPLPYFIQFKWLRMVVLMASYFFNLFSALTASTLVFFFALQLSGHWLPSAIVTLVFLILLEVSKRMTAAANFKNHFQHFRHSLGMVTASLMLMGISVSFSYFGGKKAVKEFTPPPVVVNIDSLTAPLHSRLSAIDEEITAARATRYKGTTTRTSQRTIETLTSERADLQNKIFDIENNTSTDNAEKEQSHTLTTAINADTFALITLFSELLFLICGCYLEYFDWRSFVEIRYQPKRGVSTTLSDNDITPLKNKELPPQNFDNDMQFLIERARRNYNAYKSKIKLGKGYTETNLAGLEKWKKELEILTGELINEEIKEAPAPEN